MTVETGGGSAGTRSDELSSRKNSTADSFVSDAGDEGISEAT